MAGKITPSTALLLTIPPLMWAGNAVVGRLVHTMVPPLTLNFLRWLIALLILLPLAGSVLRPASGMWRAWRRFALLGLLGIGLYNSLQYMALQSSSPINVTLVASSMPVSTLLVGALFFGVPVRRAQLGGAVLSIAGVLLVLARGDWAQLLALRLVPGDLLMILATLAWAFYSWLLTRPREPIAIRADWAAFLLAQVCYGVMWSALFAGAEWTAATRTIAWSWPLAAALLYVAIGPAIIAFRCWGAGVQRAGPGVSAFFVNLTPVFTAILSAAFLGEAPHLYHLAAFALIVGGIALSALPSGTRRGAP
ncbi:MAG: DMT family transporter [Pseudomonadota bacterium]